jgi:flagellar hook-associated protein 1 FlgK
MKTTGDKEMSSSDFINGASAGSDIYDKYDNLTAKSICVSSDVLNDYNLIATSGVAKEAGNIDTLNSLLGFRHNADMFSEGAPEDFMKSLVSTLGIDSQQAENYQSNQKTIVTQITNRRTAD